MLNAEIQTGLEKIGFVEDLLSSPEAAGQEPSWNLVPSFGAGGFEVQTIEKNVTIQVFDESGRLLESRPYQKGELIGIHYTPGKYLVTIKEQKKLGYRWFVKI
jgi:hypothetical protein